MYDVHTHSDIRLPLELFFVPENISEIYQSVSLAPYTTAQLWLSLAATAFHPDSASVALLARRRPGPKGLEFKPGQCKTSF